MNPNLIKEKITKFVFIITVVFAILTACFSVILTFIFQIKNASNVILISFISSFLSFSIILYLIRRAVKRIQNQSNFWMGGTSFGNTNDFNDPFNK